MTLTSSSLPTLSDRVLLAELKLAVGQERQATAHVIALLMEVDARRLYAQQSCSSLFTYCIQVLHLSEHAAYLRIEAARAVRRFPVILDRLADGSLHLTAVRLVAVHLTAANHLEVLDASRHKTKREVEQLVARLRPQPEVPPVIRKLPTLPSQVVAQTLLASDEPVENRSTQSPAVAPSPTCRPAAIRPVETERFKLQFTVSRETYEKLRQVQDLLRHTNPDGDPAVIFDRALTLLAAELSKRKFGNTDRPRAARAAKSEARHVPAAVKREVWRRDGGQCAFRGETGRCRETGWLEFHHVVPYARGGPTNIGNIELRCRPHNVYEAELQFGRQASSLWTREPSPGSRSTYHSVQTERTG